MLVNRKMNIVVLDDFTKKMRRSKSVCCASFVMYCKSTTYLTSSNLTHIDYQRIMFVWDKYGRFKLLFYK